MFAATNIDKQFEFSKNLITFGKEHPEAATSSPDTENENHKPVHRCGFRCFSSPAFTS